MQSGAFLSHGDAAGNLKVFSNRTFILFYKVLIVSLIIIPIRLWLSLTKKKEIFNKFQYIKQEELEEEFAL